MDEADLADAIYTATLRPRDGGDQHQARRETIFRGQLARLLDDLPGELEVRELRTLLENSEADEGG